MGGGNLEVVIMRVQQHPQVGFVCTCENCGASAHVQHPQQFAKNHRCTRIGMGDVIARGTKALGVKPCSPCEERRRKLNGMFPSFWKR